VTEIIPFNPLDRQNLGASVAEAMLARKPYKLAAVPAFLGAGMYALYYSGAFAPYAPIAQLNSNGKLTSPIYIGKAIPEGARRGSGVSDGGSTKALARRLAEHAQSIEWAENLDANDFDCRFLVVDDIWIPLGESLLIAKFAPLWNVLVDGFGNHDPGSGRHSGLRSRWDSLHPGRPWAAKCRAREESADEIARDVCAFLRANPPSSSQLIVDPNGSAANQGHDELPPVRP
jgi:hypothetical protein